MVKKILFILFIITRTSFGQEFYISSSIAYSIAAGITEGLKLEEREMYKSHLDNDKRVKLNKLWHKTQFVERGLAITLGITIGAYSEFNWKKLIASTLLSAAIFWNVYDATINIVRGHPMLHVSNTSQSFLEQYSSFKIPVLALAFLVNHLLIE